MVCLIATLKRYCFNYLCCKLVSRHRFNIATMTWCSMGKLFNSFLWHAALFWASVYFGLCYEIWWLILHPFAYSFHSHPYKILLICFMGYVAYFYLIMRKTITVEREGVFSSWLWNKSHYKLCCFFYLNIGVLLV